MIKNRWFLFSLTGALLALSFPPIPTWFITFFAFVPLFIAFEKSNSRLFLLSYLTFFIYHGGTNWWISSWQENADPFLVASGIAVAIVHPLFFTIPIFIQNYFNKKLGFQKAIWLFPFAWTSFEWWHSLGDISYPWITIGYTQIYNKFFAQIADIGGVWFISFLLVLINVIIYKIYYYKYIDINKVQLKNLSISLIVLLVSIYTYGFIQFTNYSKMSENPQNKVKVGIIQPNINPWKKWDNYTAVDMIKIHKDIQDSLIVNNPNIDLFIWSETAITYLNSEINSEHNFSFIQQWVNKNNTSLLSGFSDFVFYKKGDKLKATSKYFLKDSSRAYDTYNASVLINVDTTYKASTQVYHKMKLTPFSEYLPYPELLTFLRRFVEWGVGISSWAKGENQFNLKLDNNRVKANVASVICIESIYPYFVSCFTSQGADFLAVITNDGWYDNTAGPEQHFIISEMRAIENRRYIARCANTGISGIISPAGERLKTAEQYKSTGIVGDVYKMYNKSIYVIFGDMIAYISVILLFLFWIILIFRKK